MADHAKDWDALGEALQRYVRLPLLDGREDDWKRFNPREFEFQWSVSKDLARAHYLPKETNRDSVLWYTLIYSCMHFDALTSLMNTDEFTKTLDFQSETSSSVLHVDFGCGPGTAAWSVMKNLPVTAHVETIGYDHNIHMTNLAEKMVKTIAQSLSKDIISNFLSEWSGFQNQVIDNSKQKDIVLITANSLFGQQSFSSSHLDDIIDLIKNIRVEAQQALIVMYGTHPPYSQEMVAQTWHRIAEETQSATTYDQKLLVSTWSPIRCIPDIHSSWHPWNNPQPQLARILVLPPAGGKR